LLRVVFGDNEAARDLYFRFTYRRNLGWKHAIAPTSQQVQALGMDQVVFVTLTKNPYAWLLSLYRRPYHHRSETQSLATFVQTAWPTVKRENYAGPCANPVVLWNEKNRSYLNLARSGACACNLRYEDVLRDPASVVTGIAKTYDLPPTQSQFSNVTQSTKGEPGKKFDDYRCYYLQEQWRSKLDAEVLALINIDLDEDVVTRLGYTMIRG
jgi:hypothetical protein